MSVDSAWEVPRTLPISEIFGPTIQGEGPASGELCSFLRFGGCNLGCWWCDSAYTWDGERFDLREEITMLSADEVLKAIPLSRVCVVTGGEPLLYQRRAQFLEVLRGLKSRGQNVHIETNGTLGPISELADLVETFVVSPKLGHARAQKGRVSPRMDPQWSTIAQNCCAHLKVVVQSEEDVKSTVRLAQRLDWDLRRVWIMPEGVDRATLDRRWAKVCDWAIKHGVNVSHRLHVLAWGEERGH